MSGTEAVMAAVRLARFNTRPQVDRVLLRRVSRLVGRRDPGLGSERPLDDCLTLKDLSPASLV